MWKYPSGREIHSELFDNLYKDALGQPNKVAVFRDSQEDYPGYGYANSLAQSFAWDLADTATDLYLECRFDENGLGRIGGYVSDRFGLDEYLPDVVGRP